MDDIDSSFPARTKEDMIQAVAEALFEGKYPGWKDEMEEDDDEPVGKPMFHKDGSIVKSRARKAATKLGRQMMATFFDDLEGVDLHSAVSCAYMLCICCIFSSDCRLLVQSGLDPMHTVDLGIWVHLLTAISVRIDSTVRKYGILKGKKIEAVWDRIVERAGDWDQDESLFKMNKFKAQYMRHLLAVRQSKDKKQKNIEAWEHHLIMLVISCIYTVYLLLLIQLFFV